MYLRAIKTYCEKAGKTVKELAESIGMSEQNLHRCVRENKIQAQDLESIAKELHVSILEFFDEEVGVQLRQAGRDYVERGKIEHKGTNGSGTVEADLRDQIAQLKSQLADKERIIKLMEDRL